MRILNYVLIALLVIVAGCGTAVTIKDANGKPVMVGNLSNGSMSNSTGAACVPAVPSPAAPIPVVSGTPPLMFERAPSGRLMLVQQGAAEAVPTCTTTVATVRGTDNTTWGMFGLAIAAAIKVLFL